MTSKDVADAAGVSRTAVSFAFNDPGRISSATRERILTEAGVLGYRPHPVASMLARGRTNSIGLLLPQDIPQVMQNPYYAQFMVGLGKVCHTEGLTLLVVPPLRNSMLEAIPYAAVDGFIVCGLEQDRGEVAELRQRNIPFVLVDGDPTVTDDRPSFALGAGAPTGECGVSAVDVDDEVGAAAMTDYLLDLGHRRIAVLAYEAGPADHGTFHGTLARRMTGIDTALRRHDLSLNHPDVVVVESACTRVGGYQATRTLLDSSRRRPTAVFALSDILAAGAMDAARDLALDVPSQLSIGGFDDQPEAVWLRPQLTTVRQPIEAKGRVAGDLLVDVINQRAPFALRQTLHTSLIVRQSTGRVPARVRQVGGGRQV